MRMKTSLGPTKKQQDKAYERIMKKKKAKKTKLPSDKPKKKINSRTKGKVGELEFANFLKERGIEARRGQQFKGGTDSPDVMAGGCMARVHIEVKRVQAGNLYNWYKQACTDANICHIPVVAHRRNGKQWMAILDMRDFITVMEHAHEKIS